MDKAFVLGAGLGTRLRTLTERTPKPLIPVFNRPLITWAFDHLLAHGSREFIVNTHHLPEKYREAFPGASYRGATITLRHEPVLLDTAGGIANIADLVRDQPFLVYNGDILADFPLAPLLETHARDQNLVTLALRSAGPGRHIALDQARARVTDIRNLLGTGDPGTHQFTGVYSVSPEFMAHLTPGKVESVIPVFLRLIAAGRRIGGVVIDEGQWWDLGNRENLLEAHREIRARDGNFPAYARAGEVEWRSPRSVVHPDARLLGCTVIGEGCEVGAAAVLQDCLLWPGARVAPGAQLTRCIVRHGMAAEGTLIDADV